MRKIRLFANILAIFGILIFGATTSFAQTTEFSYQGFLNDTSASANGNFDFEFRLYSANSGGTLEGTNQRLNVPVTRGVFSVTLDFGAGAFPGADRFLEMSVKPSVGGSFTTLAPRQRIGRTPYAISSGSADQASFAINATNAANATTATTANNALQLSGITANQFVQTTDSRLTNDRNPLPNSPNYIQNSASPQTASNFNISGNGTIGGTLRGNLISATTQFNIGNNRILSNTGTSNLFGGVNAGNANTTGTSNTFFGQSAGSSNLDGNRNTFFGNLAGAANTTGSNNSLFGSNANLGSNNLSNATAIGFRAFVESNDSLVLGSVNGKNGATSDTFVGIGTTAPNTPLDIESELVGTANLRITNYGDQSVIAGRSSGGTRTAPTSILASDKLLTIQADGRSSNPNTFAPGAKIEFVAGADWVGPARSTRIDFFTAFIPPYFVAPRMTINGLGNVGIGTVAPVQKLDVEGNIRVGTGTTGCIEDRDGTVIAGTCSSDLRFKKNIIPFGNVLNNFSKLRPVNFYWRADDFADKNFGANQSFGLIAQDVEQLFPELVSTDEKGYKMVNYSKLPLYTIQAVNELKAENDALKTQIEEQKKQVSVQQSQLEKQKTELDELKKTVSTIQANIAKPKTLVKTKSVRQKRTRTK